ncbi:hypothetical protein ACJVC5_06975 [Peredibacter sp. HCB2-198]|uniref:hypothetical protein n=1 Tax=Peredibacter sp. HCB2-198 TaxID=3383025 RepID=UPI0038B54DA6
MKRIIFLSIFILLTACDGKKSSKEPTSIVTTTEEVAVETTPPVEEPSEESSPEISTVESETPIIIVDEFPEEEQQPEEKIEPELPPTTIVTEPEPIPSEHVPQYDYDLLEEKGIHVEGRSILSELNYPAAIYCSNTKYLNSEKILELRQFFLFLDETTTKAMDDIDIQTSLLKKMIQKSISELETNENSRFCPKIYLAIGTD